MSEKLASVPVAAPRALGPMSMQIIGKIEAVRRYEGKCFTRVICPAADLYSKPSVVEIRSTARLGSKDEEVNVTGRLGGYMRKAYRVTDKDSGEIVTIVPVDHTIDLVE